MREKDFQTKFSKWCKYNIKETARFELKFTKKGFIPFNALKPHQEQGLSNNSVSYKLPDSDPAPKPFDCFTMVDEQGYIVVQFYTRGCKRFYMIRIEDWLMLKDNLNRKSITESYARMFGTICELS